MNKSIWYLLGKEAAESIKSAGITSSKPLRVRHQGRFFSKAPGSTKTAPNHSSLGRVTNGVSPSIPVM
jgi:hypothetical protein